LEEHSDPTQEEEEEEKGDSTYEYGVGRHTDYGVFTMILCDDVEDTLQILPKTKPAKAALLSTRGTEDDRLLYQEHWLNVDPIPGGFVCNIGDMLARWTNGIYMSTPHRALRPRTQDRISVPFFFDPSYDALISPIDELVNRQSDHRPQRPSFDEPIMYGDHLLAKTSKNFQV
jgi:isopenicillin N synthase-like dioxygenase